MCCDARVELGGIHLNKRGREVRIGGTKESVNLLCDLVQPAGYEYLDIENLKFGSWPSKRESCYLVELAISDTSRWTVPS